MTHRARDPKTTEALEEAIAIMARLRGPDGCPWDREQTFDSIMKYTLEETYEVFDAIERRAWPDLKDELGDLLLQVLFYAQMADEAGHFAIKDVAANLNAKLIRRHPHIFAHGSAETAAEVKQMWDAIKRKEKGDLPPTGLLEAVSRHTPALTEARKLGAKAAQIGFDWPDAFGLLEKLAEEAGELKAEMHVGTDAKANIFEEFGDLLFTAVQLGRHLGVDPEFALRSANAKFRGRFQAMEKAAGGEDNLAKLDAAQLEQEWIAAKTVSTAAGEQTAEGG